MMTLNLGAASGLAAGKAMAVYLLEQSATEQPLNAANYYGQDAGAVLQQGIDPELADALGLEPNQAITTETLANLLSGRRADGDLLPGQHQHKQVETYGEGATERHRVAYLDLTLSAPKHLSIAWAFAEGEGERDALLQAHRTARDETLRYVEQQAIRGRLGDGGKDGFEPGKMATIVVDHFTARPTVETVRTDPVTGEVYTELHNAKVAGDPAVHSHCLIPNLIKTESGRFVALDTGAFHGRIHEFGAVYQALLTRELTKMGVVVELDPKTNMARLSAIPEHVVDEFSKRSRDGEKAARTKAERDGLDWNTMSPEDQAGYRKAGTHATRQTKKTGAPDITAWRAQAKALGWQHKTVLGPQAAQPTRRERLDQADGAGLPHLAEMLTKRSVLGQGDARTAIARGFIAAGGLDATDDIGVMARHWAKGGVMQDGRWTKLVWREVERGKIKITTELHRDQEAELVGLAQKAASDRRHALTPAAIEGAVARSGVSYRGDHGKSQRGAVETLGTDGALAVVIGVAGSGKSTGILKPLVNAWRHEGADVWGTGQAWRQAKDLRGAGIEQVRALDPFLRGAAEGAIRLHRNSVVVLDEVGRIGTRQLLELLRLQDKRGFKLVLMGDDKQAVAIEAGPVVDLLRRALGEGRVPEILTTIRQDKEHEQEVARLFRDGKATEAVAEKRMNGTAELVPGGYRQAIERVADLYVERRAATKGQISISAPTNTDVHEISKEIRERRRAAGEIGPDQARIETVDNQGQSRTLDLAVGDHVRLFVQTRAMFPLPDGGHRSAVIGDNGTVLDVVSVDRLNGIELRGESGKAGFVSWEALRDKISGRLRLGAGEALTTDSSQGITSDEHIDATPNGTGMMPRGKAYVAASRHRVRHHMVGSMGAEMKEARSRRMTGLPEMTPDEAAEGAWQNFARNLARDTKKESALDLLDREAVAKATKAAPEQAKQDPAVLAAAWAVSTGDLGYSEALDRLVVAYLRNGGNIDGLDAYEKRVGEQLADIAGSIKYAMDILAEKPTQGAGMSSAA